MPDLQETPHEQIPSPVPAFPKTPGHVAPISVSRELPKGHVPPCHPQIHGGAMTWAVPSPSYGVPRVEGVLNPPILWGSLLQRGSRDTRSIGVSHLSLYRSPHCRGYPHPSHFIGAPTLQGIPIPCHRRGSRCPCYKGPPTAEGSSSLHYTEFPIPCYAGVPV